VGLALVKGTQHDVAIERRPDLIKVDRGEGQLETARAQWIGRSMERTESDALKTGRLGETWGGNRSLRTWGRSN